MKKVLVTGANGQLAQCIRAASPNYPSLEFTFLGKYDLDLENEENLQEFFDSNTYDVCINTAAYTNVEKAESERDKAFEVNANAIRRLARICDKKDVLLIHISTDYVFDGTASVPYMETDDNNPLNVYGASKLEGERHIIQNCKRYYIIRTSWLYSQYGHNFFNTILKYASEGKALTITTEQTGTPTNANDLAEVLLIVAASKLEKYGLYHFSNGGEASWFDFAEAILLETGQIKHTSLEKTDHYRTFAARPKFSVLNCEKIKAQFGLNILQWKESLRTIIQPND